MRHLAIIRTTDAFQGLTDRERKELLKCQREQEQEKTRKQHLDTELRKKVCRAFDWSYCGFSVEQVQQLYNQIYK